MTSAFLRISLKLNKPRYFCTFLENVGKMCCSEMWKHQRRSEENKHAQDSFLWHHMPAKTEEAKKWIDFMLDRRKMWTPGKTSSLCSMHFNDEDFTRLMNSGLNLKRELK